METIFSTTHTNEQKHNYEQQYANSHNDRPTIFHSKRMEEVAKNSYYSYEFMDKLETTTSPKHFIKIKGELTLQEAEKIVYTIIDKTTHLEDAFRYAKVPSHYVEKYLTDKNINVDRYDLHTKMSKNNDSTGWLLYASNNLGMMNIPLAKSPLNIGINDEDYFIPCGDGTYNPQNSKMFNNIVDKLCEEYFPELNEFILTALFSNYCNRDNFYPYIMSIIQGNYIRLEDETSDFTLYYDPINSMLKAYDLGDSYNTYFPHIYGKRLSEFLDKKSKLYQSFMIEHAMTTLYKYAMKHDQIKKNTLHIRTVMNNFFDQVYDKEFTLPLISSTLSTDNYNSFTRDNFVHFVLVSKNFMKLYKKNIQDYNNFYHLSKSMYRFERSMHLQIVDAYLESIYNKLDLWGFTTRNELYSLGEVDHLTEEHCKYIENIHILSESLKIKSNINMSVEEKHEHILEMDEDEKKIFIYGAHEFSKNVTQKETFLNRSSMTPVYGDYDGSAQPHGNYMIQYNKMIDKPLYSSYANHMVGQSYFAIPKSYCHMDYNGFFFSLSIQSQTMFSFDFIVFLIQSLGYHGEDLWENVQSFFNYIDEICYSVEINSMAQSRTYRSQVNSFELYRIKAIMMTIIPLQLKKMFQEGTNHENIFTWLLNITETERLQKQYDAHIEGLQIEMPISM